MSPRYKPNLLSCVRYSSLDDIYIDEFTDGPAEGTYLKHFDNDKIEEEKEFKNGLAHGSYKRWWPDGKLMIALYRVMTLIAPRTMILGHYPWFRKNSGDE